MVKDGYKGTEIGTIPSCWDVYELPQIIKGSDGIKIGPFGSQLKKEYLVKSGSYRVYGQENVYANNFRIGERYVEKDKFYSLKSCELIPGDFVISTMGTVGKCNIVPDNITPGIMDSHLIRLRVKESLINKLYLRFYISSYTTQKQIKELSVGGIMDGLSTSIIKKLKVLLPLYEEQIAIAEALSDADGLISKLEKLIAKKKAIKQGAMQQLLTGKKRLPGFTGEWVEMNLFKKSKLKARIGWQGLTTAEYLTDGYSLLITGTDFNNGVINWKNCACVDKGRYEQDTNIQIKNEDILITKDGTIGKVAYVKNLRKPATLNSGVFVVRPLTDELYATSFVFHILTSFIFDNFLSKLSAGSTINHLYQKDFVGFVFMVPPTIAEQTAIANILSDMENEIEALQKKLDKYKQIKQGMMHELLTGSIRLVNTSEEVKPQAQPIEVVHPRQLKSESHPKPFDDAIIISAIVNEFYSVKYPLGRKKVQKLLYLLRRKQEVDTSDFKKKAAGPYADEVRYKGGEPIAKNKKYIIVETSSKGSKFNKGANISEALSYIEKWNMQVDIAWLSSHFLRYDVNRLELLTTVDMAICDLKMQNIPASVESIKSLICSDNEWKAKLAKAYFSDKDIAWAIGESEKLFG